MKHLRGLRLLGSLMGFGFLGIGFSAELPINFGPGFAELEDFNQQGLMTGNMIIFHTNVQGAPWPRATLYKKLSVKPLEAVAIFTDFDKHSEFIPDVNYSKVSSGKGEAVQQVDYHMVLPFPYNGDWYTVENALSTYGNGSSYQVSWHVVRSGQVYEGVGSARFEPLGDETLMIYDNLTRPKNPMAGAVRARANANVRNLVWAWVNRIESQKTEDPESVNRRVADFIPVSHKAPVTEH